MVAMAHQRALGEFQLRRRKVFLSTHQLMETWHLLHNHL